jgi:hypothetical protein
MHILSIFSSGGEFATIKVREANIANVIFKIW